MSNHSPGTQIPVTSNALFQCHNMFTIIFYWKKKLINKEFFFFALVGTSGCKGGKQGNLWSVWGHPWPLQCWNSVVWTFSNYFTSRSQVFRSNTKMADERLLRWGAQPEKTWLWACHTVPLHSHSSGQLALENLHCRPLSLLRYLVYPVFSISSSLPSPSFFYPKSFFMILWQWQYANNISKKCGPSHRLSRPPSATLTYLSDGAYVLPKRASPWTFSHSAYPLFPETLQ